MDRTTVSIRVGSCHETTEPVAMPMPCRPAATRSARSRNWPKVTVSPSGAMSMGWSGDAWARRSTSSHMVRAPVSISLVVMTPPSGTTLIAAGGGVGAARRAARRGRGRMAPWRDARCTRRPIRWSRRRRQGGRPPASGRLVGIAVASPAGLVRGGQPAGRPDRLLGLPPPGPPDPGDRDLGPARGSDHGPGHAAQAQGRGVAAPPPAPVRRSGRGGPGSLGWTWGRRCKSVTAFRSGDRVLSCAPVETATQAGTKGHILVVRARGACKHGAQMDVEIPGGRW